MRTLRLDDLADGGLLLQSAILNPALLVDNGLDFVSSTKDLFAELIHGERFVDHLERSGDGTFLGSGLGLRSESRSRFGRD